MEVVAVVVSRMEELYILEKSLMWIHLAGFDVARTGVASV